jgi:hypothetical protein
LGFPDLTKNLQHGLEGRGVLDGPEVIDNTGHLEMRETEGLHLVKIGTKLDEGWGIISMTAHDQCKRTVIEGGSVGVGPTAVPVVLVLS